MSDDFPIRSWKWIFYIYGWLTGATNLLFWLIMLVLYAANKEKYFFSNAFHQRVFVWGIVMFIITFVMIIFIAILLAVLFTGHTAPYA